MKIVSCQKITEVFRKGEFIDAIWVSKASDLPHGSKVGVLVSEEVVDREFEPIESLTQTAETQRYELVLAVRHVTQLEWLYGFRGESSNERIKFLDEEETAEELTFSASSQTSHESQLESEDPKCCGAITVALRPKGKTRGTKVKISGVVEAEPIRQGGLGNATMAYWIDLDD